MTVSLLPDLDQTLFPRLPGVPDGDGMIIPFGTPLGNTEAEMVLGILTTAAVRAGKWAPVSADRFVEIANQGVVFVLLQGTINAMHRLIGEGAIQMIEVPADEGTADTPAGQYLVPTPQFAANLPAARLNLRWTFVPKELRPQP